MEEMFSHRVGITQPRKLVQQNSIDDALKTAIWNTIYSDILFPLVEGECTNSEYEMYEKFTNKLWIDFLKGRIDKCPEPEELPDKIEAIVFSSAWFQAYNLIDYIALTFPIKKKAKDFIRHCNIVLEKELSPYRFVGNHLMPDISNEEIKEVEVALDSTRIFTEHLDRALELLTDRKNPDYRNSIKESISAVEAVCQIITGNTKATLNDALKKLSENGITLHPSLKNAFSQIYGYTSDADGIRHALQGKSDIDAADARFMFIVCSTFINYLIALTTKAGLDLKKRKARYLA